MKARKGSLSPVTVAFQPDPETVPTSGGFQVSHYSESFNASDGLNPDPAIEHAPASVRDPQDPAAALRRAGGGISPPLDFNQLTFWLQTLLGAPTVTGESAPYTHVFKSGQAALAPFALSVPVTDDHWKLVTFAVANTFSFSLNPEDGFKQFDMGCLARDSVLVGTEPAFSSTTPTLMAKAKAPGSLATFGIDGALVANITGGNFQYSNNAQMIDLVDGSALGADYDADDASVRTDLTARLVQGANNNAILDRFTGQVADAFPAYIEVAVSAALSLRIDMPRCVGERRQPGVGGRGTLNFSAGLQAYPSGSTPAATFTLKNATAGIN